MSCTRFALPALAYLSILGCTQAAPPKPDFADLPAYITALNTSHDPQAAAIRREIADGPAALAREKAAAQKDGISLTVVSPALSPTDQNAAPLWNQWDALRKQNPLQLPNYAETLSAWFVYTPEQLASVQHQFDTHPTLVQLLHQAADRTALFYPNPLYLHYAGLREAARELKTESYLLAHEGRYTDAVTDQARGFNLAKQFGSCPTIINYLVGVAVEAITLQGMQDILSGAGSDAAIDTRVQQTIGAAQPILSLKMALAGEVPATMAEFSLIRTDESNGLAQMFFAGPGRVPRQKPLSGADKQFTDRLLDASEAYYLQRMHQLITAADLPSLERRDTFKRVTDEKDAATDADPVQSFGDFLLSVTSTSDGLDDKRLSQEQVTLAAAAILAAKAQTGAFPATLPGDFPDPFTGKALGYRPEGPYGFVVYSVGADGTFDGGKPATRTSCPAKCFFATPARPRSRCPPIC